MKVNNVKNKLISLASLPFLLVLVMWLVYWLEIRMDISLNRYGIYPRTFKGIQGIFFGPFIHGDAEHLWRNTLPIFILSTTLRLFYVKESSKILFIGFLVTGILTWCIARSSFHIGMSGVIYMLVSFLFFKGIITQQSMLIRVSLTVVFLYGGLLWFMAPVDGEMSWEGHLSGFITGLLLSFSKVNIAKSYQNHTYAWESPTYDESKDLFMQCFDENGRFVPVSHSSPIINVLPTKIVTPVKVPKLLYTSQLRTPPKYLQKR